MQILVIDSWGMQLLDLKRDSVISREAKFICQSYLQAKNRLVIEIIGLIIVDEW